MFWKLTLVDLNFRLSSSKWNKEHIWHTVCLQTPAEWELPIHIIYVSCLTRAGDDSRKFFSSLPCGGLGVSRNLFTVFKLHRHTETLPWLPRVALQKGLSVTRSACCKIWSFLFQTDLWILRWWQLRLRPIVRACPSRCVIRHILLETSFVRLSCGRRTFPGTISK